MYALPRSAVPRRQGPPAVVAVTEKRPTAVTDDEAKPAAITLPDGETAFLTTIRRDFVGNEARQETAASAAKVSLVATLSQLPTEESDRSANQITSNHEHELLGRAGLSLRVPPISRTANDQGLYGFYPYQQAMLRTIADASWDRQIQLPEGERARRALSYVGAELITDRRLEEETGEHDSDDQAAEEVDTAFEDDQFNELHESLGFDADSDPRAVVEWIEEALTNDHVSYIAARAGRDPESERETLERARYELNKRIHWLELQAGDDEVEANEGASAHPDPADGVLGYDWVRTGDHQWTGRSLRGLLYAVLTEPEGLDLSTDSVDRVELINYGEPTVRAYEVPSDRRDLTLVSGDDPPGHPDHLDRHAVDFRVVGDFDDVEALTEERVVNAVRQHLNTLQLLARYDNDMLPRADGEELSNATDSGDDSNESLAADGAGPAGMTEEAKRRTDDARLETPFDDLVPRGLREAMDKVHHARRNGGYDIEAYITDSEIVGTSHSWETDR